MMNSLGKLRAKIKKAAQKLRSLNPKSVKIITHYDTDGICAAAIIASLFEEKADISYVSADEDFSLEGGHDLFFILDLGSIDPGVLDTDKEIFIFDHHKSSILKNRMTFINTSEFEEKNPNFISAAGISYLFAKEVKKEMTRLAYLAIIGGIGDSILNGKDSNPPYNEVIEDGINHGNVERKKDIRILASKPLFKVLGNYTDPFIPGVSGKFGKVVEFLNESEIPLSKGDRYTTLEDLSERQKKRLEKAIVNKRKNEKIPEDIYGNFYYLKDIPEPFNNAYEFSTLVNACGRMGSPEVGFRICLKEPAAFAQASGLLKEYKHQLRNTILWCKKNRKKFASGNDYVIIDLADKVKPAIIGIISSIIAHSGIFKQELIICLGKAKDNTIKFSLRNTGRDLTLILKEACEGLECKYGGHNYAAGAHIRKEDKKRFMRRLRQVLDDSDEPEEQGKHKLK